MGHNMLQKNHGRNVISDAPLLLFSGFETAEITLSASMTYFYGHLLNLFWNKLLYQLTYLRGQTI